MLNTFAPLNINSVKSRYSLGKALLLITMTIFTFLFIISCKQEQDSPNPTENSNLTQSDAKFSDWSTPVNLGPVINSANLDQQPFLSKNKLSLFFSSDRPGGIGDVDIWVSERPDENSPWQMPQNLGPNINSVVRDGPPSLSYDEHWLYFASPRAGGCGGLDIYVAHRQNKSDNFGWEPAVNLGCVINSTFGDAGPDIFNDDELGITTMYFQSDRPGGLGNSDIWTSILLPDGTFGPAVLVPSLSSPVTEGRCSIRRRDGLEIILASTRAGGIGASDIWVSTRSTTLDLWPIPENLGTPINTTNNEGFPSLSFDGLTLIFSSDRPGGFGLVDLYLTTRTKIH